MDRLTLLASTLKELKDVSKSVLGDVLPIMEELANGNSELADELNYKSRIDKETITEELRLVTIRLVEDSERILKEIDTFTTYVIEGDDPLKQHYRYYPFLASVWYGDVYDCEKTDALQMLLKSIKQDRYNCTERWILNQAKKELIGAL